ncbi:haloacid dehalogenase type II [Rhizobium sp. S152]|uniref:haloacid dehalogenase type II n=1 Tax=Rhizobium sp. S152 TaxID=3055038 RepID=UPI0025AA1470|nr:haloacid dehalogenase type II [Rhizobium sp. S152]MDM9627660.1 haloacid dehalogenase type II [Rhizobium sp. S152]
MTGGSDGERPSDWPAKKRSFDSVEAAANRAVKNLSLERVPPEPSYAPEPPFNINPTPKIITFDCYGTLVQWYEVLLREVGRAASGDRKDLDARQILEAFSKEARRATAEKPHRLYQDILRSGFRAAFRMHGLQLHDDDLERIANSPKTMGPHPDVPDALGRLRERYKLAIFTNSDDDLIAPTVEGIGVPFDYVITAEQAQAYKPSRKFFEHAYRNIGVNADETVHVAMGMYWDMKARHELGFRAIWVNRRNEKGNPDWLPYSEVADVHGAADLLLPS